MTSKKVRTKRYKFIGKKKMTILMMFFTFFIFISVFLIPNLGQWLVVEDQLIESDIIVVLSGSLNDRILQAVDIYNKKYSDKIVLINTYNPNYDIFPKIGLGIPTRYAQLNKIAAINLGIPEENILILEGDAKRTQDEALIITEYIRNNRAIESMILVTSKYHSDRAKKIFKKTLSGLDREINIYSSPSKYDPFNASKWWRDREDIKWVILEYLKLVKFYFWDQFLLN